MLDPVALENDLSVMSTTDPFLIKGEMPTQRDNVLFTNDTGNLFIGMWDSTAFESEMRPFPCHEFVQLLEGEVEITEEDGTVNLFKSGDAFFTPMGTVCRWKTTGHIKKFYSILQPTMDKTPK